MRNVIHSIIKNIDPLDELEREHQSDVLGWIESGADLFRLEKPAIPPKHLVSYFVLVDLERELLLLVDHKKAQLWLPAGGHVELDEHPKDTADRELYEELGVNLTLLQPDPLFLTVTKTVGHEVFHEDVSLWYVYGADASQTYAYDEREFNGIQWFPLHALPLDRSDPHLDRFRQKLSLSP